jgi:hypothetical protein
VMLITCSAVLKRRRFFLHLRGMTSYQPIQDRGRLGHNVGSHQRDLVNDIDI